MGVKLRKRSLSLSLSLRKKTISISISHRFFCLDAFALFVFCSHSFCFKFSSSFCLFLSFSILSSFQQRKAELELFAQTLSTDSRTLKHIWHFGERRGSEKKHFTPKSGRFRFQVSWFGSIVLLTPIPVRRSLRKGGSDGNPFSSLPPFAFLYQVQWWRIMNFCIDFFLSLSSLPSPHIAIGFLFYFFPGCIQSYIRTNPNNHRNSRFATNPMASTPAKEGKTGDRSQNRIRIVLYRISQANRQSLYCIVKAIIHALIASNYRHSLSPVFFLSLSLFVYIFLPSP